MTDYSSELGQVQLEVADLDLSVAFYRKFLGLEVTERVDSQKGRLAFLSGNARHHELALRAAPAGGTGRGNGGRTVDPRVHAEGEAFSAPFQLGFELDGRQSFADLLYLLRREDVPATVLDHGISWALYFRDPDGNALKAYWDVREEEGGRSRWGGESRLIAVDQVLSDERVRRLLEDAEEAREAHSGDAGAGEAGDEAGAEGGGSPEVAGDRSGTGD